MTIRGINVLHVYIVSAVVDKITWRTVNLNIFTSVHPTRSGSQSGPFLVIGLANFIHQYLMLRRAVVDAPEWADELGDSAAVLYKTECIFEHGEKKKRWSFCHLCTSTTVAQPALVSISRETTSTTLWYLPSSQSTSVAVEPRETLTYQYLNHIGLVRDGCCVFFCGLLMVPLSIRTFGKRIVHSERQEGVNCM